MNPYIIIGALVGFILAFIIGGVFGYEYRAAKVPQELIAQQIVDTQTFNKAQQITKVENDKLSKSRDDIAAKLADSLRKPSTCARITRSPQFQPSGSKYAGQDGTSISSDWLRSYAAEAENYRSELLICTDFIKKERDLTQPTE